jgi:hypothetical protein
VLVGLALLSAKGEQESTISTLLVYHWSQLAVELLSSLSKIYEHFQVAFVSTILLA